ncbi:MAG: sulfur carrier protein ThiS [Desulfovibrionales bacterium]|nr:sulfur carrier protein ThiS [Desulfovibrionales bacterium]
MRVIVNGREMMLDGGLSLRDLIASVHADPAVVVAELNRNIVPSSAFSETMLQDGDRVELLSFVGGG